MNKAKVVDYDIDVDDIVQLILDNNTTIPAPYIKLKYTRMTDTIVRQELKEEFINILNEIHLEHIKLTILGSGYPEYGIDAGYMKKRDNVGLIVSIMGINTELGSLETYKVKKIVSSIWIDEMHSFNVKELVLTHPIKIYSLGSNNNIKIVGVENLLSINGRILKIINSNILNTSDKTLRLKHLEYFTSITSKISGIEHIILEDTCKVTELPLDLLNNLVSLKSITICKSINTIERIHIDKCIRRYKDMYYMLIESENDRINNNDRIIEVEFNSRCEPDWAKKIPVETE